MHTISIFDAQQSAMLAQASLRREGIPSQIRHHHIDKEKELYLLQAEDEETERALSSLEKYEESHLIHCPNCGSKVLNFPGTPNHTLLARAASFLAMKAHLVEEQLYCTDCHFEWKP